MRELSVNPETIQTATKRRSTSTIIGGNAPTIHGTKRGRISFYTNEGPRMRAAYQALPGPSRQASFSEWLSEIVLAEAARIETSQGRLDPLPAGRIKKGRPLA